MNWCLEELTEDAVVAYLKAQLTDVTANVWAAFDFDQEQFPCVVVYAENQGPVVEQASWHDARKLKVNVAIMTEGPVTDDRGNIVLTMRQNHSGFRSKVLNALCVSGLLALVNAKIAKAALSMCEVVNVERGVEGRRMVTTATLDVICEPVTGSV